MACREAPTFESFVQERLSPRSEAAKMIADLSKDTSLSNAVALTIEALPAGKSRELRHIVDLFEPYCEWVEDWEAKGWQIESSGSWVTLVPPEGRDWNELCARKAHPSDEVVAAAAGVLSVKFEDVEFEPRIEISYRAG
jgi:hypothetical protein